MGLCVKFWPANHWHDPQYSSLLEQAGIEVFYGNEYVGRYAQWVEEHAADFDYVLLSRPHIAQEHVQAIREHTRAKLLFYGHDLHYARLLGEYERTGDERLLRAADESREVEQALWRMADVVYYPSASETAAVLALLPDACARTVPLYYFDPAETAIEAAGRRMQDVVFVAGFGHPPNVDAAKWLVQEIFPHVLARVPDARLLLVGSNPTGEVRALASAIVTVTGYVTDEELAGYYRRCGVAVVPLRFGAGVKGKVLEALHHGLPIVTTSVGAQGLAGLEDAAVVRDEAHAIADALVQTMADPAVWMQMAHRGRDYVHARFSQSAVRAVFDLDLQP